MEPEGGQIESLSGTVYAATTASLQERGHSQQPMTKKTKERVDALDDTS
jgi:hypothetical protein